MIKKLICLILMTYSLSVFADNAWYVSIPKSRLDPSAPWNQRFQYTSVLYLTEQGLNSPLPLNYSSCATSGCYVGVNTQNAANPNDPRYIDPEQQNVFFKGSTVGDALTALYKRLGTMTYISQATAPDRTNDNPPITWCGAIGISTSGVNASYRVLNGGECGKLPPANLECVLLTADAYLNHGTLSVEEIKTSDQIVTDTFEIKCNRDANILLSLVSPDEENSNIVDGTRIVFKNKPGLVSYLKIDDKAALTPTKFPVTKNGNNIFKVSSKLKVEGDKVAPGPFNSFAYIILSYE